MTLNTEPVVGTAADANIESTNPTTHASYAQHGVVDAAKDPNHSKDVVEVLPTEAESSASHQLAKGTSLTGADDQDALPSAELPQRAAFTNQDNANEKEKYCLSVRTFDPAFPLFPLENIRGDWTMRLVTRYILRQLRINEAHGMFAICYENQNAATDRSKRNSFVYTPTYRILDMTTKVSDLCHEMRREQAARAKSTVENFGSCFGGASELQARLTLRLCVPLVVRSSTKSFACKALHNLCTFDLPAAEYYFWQIQDDFCGMLKRISDVRRRLKNVWHPTVDDLIGLVLTEVSVYDVILQRNDRQKRKHELISFANRRFKALHDSNTLDSFRTYLNYRIDQNYLKDRVKKDKNTSTLKQLHQLLDSYFNELTKLIKEYDKSKLDLMAKLGQSETRPWLHQISDLLSDSSVNDTTDEVEKFSSTNDTTDKDVEMLSITDLNSVQLDSSHYLSVMIHNNEPWLVGCGFDSVLLSNISCTATSKLCGKKQSTKNRQWSKVPLCPVQNSIMWCFARHDKSTLVLHLSNDYVEFLVERNRLDAVYSWIHQVFHVYDDPSPNSCPCLLKITNNNCRNSDAGVVPTPVASQEHTHANGVLPSAGGSQTIVARAEEASNSQDNLEPLAKANDNLCEWPTAEQCDGKACDTDLFQPVLSHLPYKDAHLKAVKSLDRSGDYVVFACDYLDLQYHVYWLSPSEPACGKLWLLRAKLEYDPFESAIFKLISIERLHKLPDKTEPCTVPTRCTAIQPADRKKVDDERDIAVKDSEFVSLAVHDCFKKPLNTFTDFEVCLKDFMKLNDAAIVLRSKRPPDYVKSRRSTIISARAKTAANITHCHPRQVKILKSTSDAPNARRIETLRDLTVAIKVDYQANRMKAEAETVILKQLNRNENHFQLTGSFGDRVQDAFARSHFFSVELDNFPGLSRILSFVTTCNEYNKYQQSVLYKLEMGNLHAVVQNSDKQRNGFPFTCAHILQVGLQLCDTYLYLRRRRIVHGSFHLGNVLVSGFNQHSIQVRLAEPGINHIYYENEVGEPTSQLFQLYQLLMKDECLRSDMIARVLHMPGGSTVTVAQAAEAYEKRMFVQFLVIRKYLETFYLNVNSCSVPLFKRNLPQDHEILLPILFDFYTALIGVYMLNFYGRTPKNDDMLKLNQDLPDSYAPTLSTVKSSQMPSRTSDRHMESELSLMDFRSRLASIVVKFGCEFSGYNKALRQLMTHCDFVDTKEEHVARLCFKKSLWLLDQVYRDLRQLYKEYAIQKNPIAVVPANENQLPTCKLPFTDVQLWIERNCSNSESLENLESWTSSSLGTITNFEIVASKYMIPAKFLSINDCKGSGSFGTVFRGELSVEKLIDNCRLHFQISLNEEQFIRQTHFWQYMPELSCCAEVKKLSELPEGHEYDSLLYCLTKITVRKLPNQLLAVAMKIFKMPDSNEPEQHEVAISNLRKERGIQEKLTHPRILPIIGVTPRFGKSKFNNYRNLTAKNLTEFYSEYFRNNSTMEVCILPYCAMSVLNYLRECQPSLEVVLSIGVCVLEGLIYLRQQNVLHGDIATRNVLIPSLHKPHEAVIGDFSLAHVFNDSGELHCSKELSPPMSPPEALSGHFYLEKTDIWGFGTFLWELLTLGKVSLTEAYKHQIHLSEVQHRELLFTAMTTKADHVTYAKMLTQGIRLPDPIKVHTAAEESTCSKCRFNVKHKYQSEFCDLYGKHCSKLYEEVLKPCWKLEHKERPTCEECKAKLHHVLKQMQRK